MFQSSPLPQIPGLIKKERLESEQKYTSLD